MDNDAQRLPPPLSYPTGQHGVPYIRPPKAWWAVILGWITDTTVIAGLLALIYTGKIVGQVPLSLALVILALVGGVRVVDLSNALRTGSRITGSGPAVLLFTSLAHVASFLAARSRG